MKKAEIKFGDQDYLKKSGAEPVSLTLPLRESPFTSKVLFPFFEFLEFGFKYVFPRQPGPIVRGLPTAHSASPLKELIQSKESFFWPDATGEYRGQAIEPLHPGSINDARIDAKFYELISLADALRIGRTREQSLAIQELKKRI